MPSCLCRCSSASGAACDDDRHGGPRACEDHHHPGPVSRKVRGAANSPSRPAVLIAATGLLLLAVRHTGAMGLMLRDPSRLGLRLLPGAGAFEDGAWAVSRHRTAAERAGEAAGGGLILLGARLLAAGGTGEGFALSGPHPPKARGLWKPILGAVRRGQQDTETHLCARSALCGAQDALRARRQQMAFQMILSFGGAVWRGRAPPALAQKSLNRAGWRGELRGARPLSFPPAKKQPHEPEPFHRRPDLVASFSPCHPTQGRPRCARPSPPPPPSPP